MTQKPTAKKCGAGQVLNKKTNKCSCAKGYTRDPTTKKCVKKAAGGTKKPTKKPAGGTKKPTKKPVAGSGGCAGFKAGKDYKEMGTDNTYRFENGKLRLYPYKKWWGTPKGQNPWSPNSYEPSPTPKDAIAKCQKGPVIGEKQCEALRKELKPGEMMYCGQAERATDPDFKWMGAVIRDKNDGKLYNLGNTWFFMGQPRNKGRTAHQMKMPTCFPWVLKECAVNEANVCKYLEEGATYLTSDPKQGGYKGAFRWENGKYRMYASQAVWEKHGKPMKAWGPLSLLQRQNCPRGPDITIQEPTRLPKAVVTTSGPYAMQPLSLRTDASMGNNEIGLDINNESQNQNNIANMGGDSGDGGGGGGDATTALLMASLMGQQGEAQQQQAANPVYPYPNPYAMPPGYVDPNTLVPSPTPDPSSTIPPTLDPNLALLQQLMATPMPTPAPVPWYKSTTVLIIAGLVLLALAGLGAWWYFGKKSANRNNRGGGNNISGGNNNKNNFASPTPNFGGGVGRNNGPPAF